MYDAIVVGARCAGAPTAMLLAQRGYRVLLVDRATFPSDTLSTHFIKPPGVAMLRRWGLLDQVVASGCPPVTRFRLDYGTVGYCHLGSATGNVLWEKQQAYHRWYRPTSPSRPAAVACR